MLPADTHRRLNPPGPLLDPDGRPKAFMLKVNGKPYRCYCKANVFHKPDKTRSDLYECNGCGARLEAE